MAEKKFRSGFVAVLGRPNVGKSTLVNRLAGEKIAIVTPKPQTTRNKIAAVITTDSYQLILEDTPGQHPPKTALSRFMQRGWESAAADADAAVLVIDGERGVTAGDRHIIGDLQKKSYPIIAVVNKCDRAGKESVFPALSALAEQGIFKEVLPVSAKTGENCELLLQKLVSFLPEGQKYYPDDEITDKSERFLASEIVREKVLLYYQQEIPHGIVVTIEKFSEDSERGLIEIDAVLVCEKASHKPILIGKDGLALKKIGSSARPALEKLLGKKVYLTMWVKVKEDWRDSDVQLRRLGYDSKKDV